MAKKLGTVEKISIPAIGSMIFGLSKDTCADIMIQ